MNQNNIQGARQVSAEEVARVDGVPQGVPLTKEELQKTQVLNLKEFAEAVRFEKITSKKPAIIIAIIGALFIVLGSGFQVAKSLNAAKEPTIEPRNAPVQEPVEEEVVEPTNKSLTCTMATPNKPDGTDVYYTILYDFDNEKLIGFTKSYSVTATPGVEGGIEVIKTQIESFQPVITKMEGFESSVTPTETGYVANATADYLKMDLANIQDVYQSNFLTRIDFALDTPYSEVLEGMISRKFECQ